MARKRRDNSSRNGVALQAAAVAVNQEQPTAQSENSILRLGAVMAEVRLSRATIYREMDAKRFPRSVRLTGGKAVGWRRGDIQRWLDSRAVNT